MPDLVERTFLERETISFLEWKSQLLSGKIAELLTAVGDSLKIGCVWMLENPGDGFAYTFPLTVKIDIKENQPYIKLVAKVEAIGILLDELVSMPYPVPKSIIVETGSGKSKCQTELLLSVGLTAGQLSETQSGN